MRTLFLAKSGRMAGLQCHVIKNKNHAVTVHKLSKEVKILKKKLRYKKPLAEIEVCMRFHLRVIRKSVSLKFKRFCIESPCLYPSEEHELFR